ncbi:MAG: thioredoxin family protein [Halobacteria archaeon]|nr:thioredoxin family protein [Halobacteria archaeon]
MKPKKVLTVAVLVLGISVAYYSMNAAPVTSDQTYSYHGGTAWHSNYTEAKQIAQEKNKPMLLYFWATWCTYCEDYDQKVYTDEDVRNQLEDYVLVGVNMDRNDEVTERLKREYDANYPPQHVILTPDGETVTEINGYAKKETFLRILKNAKREV